LPRQAGAFGKGLTGHRRHCKNSQLLRLIQPLFPKRRQVPGSFAFNPPLTTQMVQASALPGKSVIAI
jgi:hypothetical protein